MDAAAVAMDAGVPQMPALPRMRKFMAIPRSEPVCVSKSMPVSAGMNLRIGALVPMSVPAQALWPCVAVPAGSSRYRVMRRRSALYRYRGVKRRLDWVRYCKFGALGKF